VPLTWLILVCFLKQYKGLGYFCAAASTPSLVRKLALRCDTELLGLNTIRLIHIKTQNIAFMLSSKLKVSIAFYNATWSVSNVGKLFMLMQYSEPNAS